MNFKQKKNSDGLQNKKVLITGASGGIGACMARRFAQAGAHVGLHYWKNENQAGQLKNEIQKGGGIAECFRANLIETSSRKKLIPFFLERFEQIDILINNAGAILGFKDLFELDEQAWDDTFSLNVKTPFFLAQEAMGHMKKSGGGKIINISSIAAKYGGSNQSVHYGAAKAALDAVTKGLSRAGAMHQILVNSVRAGFIDTDFHTHLNGKNLEERIRKIPLGRAGKPEDVAGMAFFLSSDAGNFITGEVFTVAGGD